MDSSVEDSLGGGPLGDGSVGDSLGGGPLGDDSVGDSLGVGLLVGVKLAMMIGVKLPGVGPGLYRRGKCSIRPPTPLLLNRNPSTSPA